ncbi:hypothetical protein N331_05641, partial [Merops nubicus]
VTGRATIEGSRSDITMNTWPPQANCPWDNFSDSFCLKPQKPGG